MKHLSSILTFLLLCGLLSAHSGKPRYHVVIDTDGALDDMRAITMFLAASDVRVLAITCSRGSLPARNTGRKVRSLLHTFHHEGIQVGTDTDLDTILPEWSSFANDVWWGKCQDVNPCDTFENATGLLKKVIHDYPYPVTLIALGSLETYAGLIRSDPEISDNIKRIIWYNEYITDRGYNYRISPESFAAIRRTGISLDIVTNKKRAWPVDQDYLSHINRARSIYARQIGSVFSQAPVLEKMHQQKLYLWDDLVPLYLTVPVLFETEGSGNLRYCYLNSQVPQAFVNEAIGKLLDSSNSPNNRVFSSFPVDSSLYLPAYSNMIHSVVKKFGLAEWKAICLTNEIHGHTGIFSIIGAKMGIRALEYFNVGVNNLKTVSYAGHQPPLSCFTDGLQISTGSTPGQGLLRVSDTIVSVPEAVFECNHQRIKISADSGIAAQMHEDITKGVKEYGLQSDAYWNYVEELAIRYWRDFDRHNIFIIEKLR